MYGLSLKEKTLAMKDFVIFLRKEFFTVSDDFGKTVFKNMIHRKIFGKYHIPAVD